MANLLLSSITVAMKAQPRWEVMDRMDVFYVGTALIIVGTVLVVSSFLALGFTGTFLGTYQTTRRYQSFTYLIRFLQFCRKKLIFLLVSTGRQVFKQFPFGTYVIYHSLISSIFSHFLNYLKSTDRSTNRSLVCNYRDSTSGCILQIEAIL